MTVPPLPTDKETILLLPGDIHLKDRAFNDNWMQTLSNQFAYVVYLMGNHEHYGCSIDLTPIRIKMAIEAHQLENVIFLNNNTFEVPNQKIKIIGGTMWSDFNKGHPVSMWTAQQTLHDYKTIRIRNHSQRLSPNYIISEHLKFKAFLQVELSVPYDGLIIVMTHHAPHQMSIDPMYVNEYHLNGAYASDLSDIILDNQNIKFWFHGHTHSSHDYPIGECRVICNPRGYHPKIADLNQNFDPYFMIQL